MNRGNPPKDVRIDSVKFDLDAFTISNDTLGNTYSARWVYKDPYLYQLSAGYPNNDTNDTIGYTRNALSFLNSFQIGDTDRYWIEKRNSEPAPTFSTVSIIDKKEKDRKIDLCINVGNDQTLGFYRGPFFRGDGALIVAFDHLLHPDSLRSQDMMIIDDELYSFKPTPDGQTYFIPANKVPNKTFEIKVGYIPLHRDSSTACYKFYHQKLTVRPPGTIPSHDPSR